MTRISAYEVPPEEDERFVAAWDEARGAAAGGGGGSAVLHRAWRADVVYRFVEVTTTDPAPPITAEGSWAVHSSVYEVVHEDGEPDGTQGVVLVNPFEVPADADEPFLAGWHAARDVLATQRGYLGTRLFRTVEPQARFRFVNIARWSSPLMFSKALQQPAIAQAAAAMPFPAHPVLYQVVRG